MESAALAAFDDVSRDPWIATESGLLKWDFATEAEAVREFRRLMAPYFHLLSEMQMQHYDGSRLRMDFIGVPKVEFPADVVGFEIKRSFNSFKDVTAATKQAIDYRHSRFIDHRVKGITGETPKYVLIFPSPVFEGGSYAGWMEGLKRAVGKFNVGFVTFVRPYWLPQDDDDLIECRVSDTSIWRSDHGTSGNGLVWKADHGRGSR